MADGLRDMACCSTSQAKMCRPFGLDNQNAVLCPWWPSNHRGRWILEARCPCISFSIFIWPKLFVGAGGARIMDFDQYLEKMNTNTKIIWIQKKGGVPNICRWLLCPSHQFLIEPNITKHYPLRGHIFQIIIEFDINRVSFPRGLFGECAPEGLPLLYPYRRSPKFSV